MQKKNNMIPIEHIIDHVAYIMIEYGIQTLDNVVRSKNEKLSQIFQEISRRIYSDNIYINGLIIQSWWDNNQNNFKKLSIEKFNIFNKEIEEGEKMSVHSISYNENNKKQKRKKSSFQNFIEQANYNSERNKRANYLKIKYLILLINKII